MFSAAAVFALFFVGLNGVSAQVTLAKDDSVDKYPRPEFVEANVAIDVLNEDIAYIDDNIQNNPNMTDADRKNGESLKVTLQLMIDDIDAGTDVEDAFTNRMHEFQDDNRIRTRDEQRKLVRVRAHLHGRLTI